MEIEGLKIGVSDLMTIHEYGLMPNGKPISLLQLAAKHMRIARQISIEAIMKAKEESRGNNARH